MMDAMVESWSEWSLLAVQSMLNSLWQGALVVLAVWMALRVIPRINAATRHTIWYATLVGLAVMPFLSGRFAPTAGFAVAEQGASDRLVSAPYEHPPCAGQPTTPSPTPAPPERRAVLTLDSKPELQGPAESPAFGAAQNKPESSRAFSPVRVTSGPWIWMLAGGWLLWAALKGVRLGVSLVRIRRIKARALPMTTLPGPLWSAWCRDARRGRQVRLGWSEELAVPAVFGFVRPAILFPSRLKSALSDTETQQVALHELAHVARYDDWWQVLQRVIEAVFFFHPAILFVSHQIALEREIACDDWVMHRLHRPREYAACLTRLVEHRSAHALPVPGAVRSKKHIIRRIEMLLNRNRNTRPGTSRGLSALAAALLSIMVVQTGFTRPVVALTSPPAPRAATPPPPAATPRVPAVPKDAARITPTAPAAAPVPHTWAQAEPPEPPEPPRPPEGAAAPTPRPDKSFHSRQDIHSGEGSTLTLNEDGDEITWSWSDGRHKVRAEMDGRVVFSSAGMAVDSISPDGYFMIEERFGGSSRELEIIPGRTGELEYYYFKDKEARPYDEDAQRWFAELLPAMMRETGLGAKERVASLRASGGATAVLEEVSLISSDYVKRIYVEALLESGPLEAVEVRALLRQIGREVDSDYEKAELLIKYADYTDGDPETRDAYVQAVAGLESDYEIRRVLSAMGTQEPLSDSYAQAVLELAGGMDSDYEKAELLLELADYSRDHVAARDLYLQAVAGIESDYEKRRVLEGVLMPRLADSAFVNQVLAIAETIGSDYERVELLIRMADRVVAHDQSLAAYIRAVGTVDSDFEARRALSALPWHDGVSDEVCIDLLGVVTRLDSDYEKAEFLLEYAEFFTASEAVQAAFDRALDSIASDYERQRVEASFYRHSRKSGSGRETY